MMKLIVLFALLAVSSAGEMKFKDCGNGEVKHVKISGCSGETCVTHRTQSLKFEVDFVAAQDTNKIELQFLAVSKGTEFHVPGIEKDACKILHCPVKKGSAQKFEYTLTVPSDHKNSNADIVAKLIGEHGVLACASIHAEVVN